jgi:orotate phosphoribosyltransferase-like protein
VASLKNKIIKQTLALKSIGLNVNEIAKRFNMSGMELKRLVKKYKKKETHIRIREWKKTLKQN